jgi:hypothetical protein
MKLICEYSEPTLEVEVIEEGTGSKKELYISGQFAAAEVENRNGRIYPKNVMSNSVLKYMKEQVMTGRAVGELNHPKSPSVNYDKVSHRITELKLEGNSVMGKALILNTPNGQIVKGLIEGGVKLGVSTRGMGNLVESNGKQYVKENFILTAVDIVHDPSAPEAFVNGIMEGVDWVWNNGAVAPQELERIETEIRSKSGPALIEAQAREFKNFLSLVEQTYRKPI